MAGIWQYEYARMMGFAKNKILMHNLTADVELFKKVSIKEKVYKYPKNFLFIGRFTSAKGLDKLIDAWSNITDKNGWTLTLVGSGPLKDDLNRISSEIIIKPFCDQTTLVNYFQNSGCFILPSIYEPWALVIHEAASAGVPIIASDICGATPHFIVNDFNGYTFSHKTKNDLKEKLEKIIGFSDENLLEMSENSRKLASRITPEIVAKTLISVIK